MTVRDPLELLTKTTSVLAKLQIPYFITGGFAVSVWGRPRATFDIDIVVQMMPSGAQALADLLKDISASGYLDEAAMQEAIKQNGEFNFIDPDTGIKVDFWATATGQAPPPEFTRRRLKNIAGQPVYFIAPEDLILSKLRWHSLSNSSRHLEDARSVVTISGEILDHDYLHTQAKSAKLESSLKDIGINH